MLADNRRWRIIERASELRAIELRNFVALTADNGELTVYLLDRHPNFRTWNVCITTGALELHMATHCACIEQEVKDFF